MKCAMCKTEIRGGAKKCPLCGSKVDYTAQIEAKKEQEKTYGSVKPQKKTAWTPSTPEDREKARERERQREEEAARMKNHSTSFKGMILAIIGTFALVVIQFLTFKFSSKDWNSYTVENLSHDLMNYKVWFGGLFIGSILIGLASYLIIRCLMEKFYNEQTIFGVILCVISIMLIVLSLSKIEERQKGYEKAQDEYSVYSERSQREIDRHNREIDDVVAQIEGELW